MTTLVADTSGLVSLATVAGEDPDPLARCLEVYEVLVPEQVVGELDELASYDDVHGHAAELMLERGGDVEAHAVTLDDEFPLDDGENAAVTLANQVETDLLLCDEFNRLGLVHASLATTRLVTTPTLLAVLVRTGDPTREEALELLDDIADARSWAENSYVERARSLLDSR